MSDYTEHARLSPSGSKKWISCAGSIPFEEQMPERISEYADDGTACHQVAAWCLTQHYRATKWIGKEIPVNGQNEALRFVEFTEDMAEMTQEYVDAVRFKTIGLTFETTWWVETRIEFSSYIGVPGQFGTVDFACYDAEHKELQCDDAKFGHRPVGVERNSQLMLYALGMYDRLSLSYDIERIRLSIHQPQVRKGAIEWTTTVDELLKWAEEVAKPAATRVMQATLDLQDVHSDEEFSAWAIKYLNPNPNDEDCAFCRAMADCPSAQQRVIDTVGADFSVIAESTEEPKQWVPEPGPRLDLVMSVTPFLEDYIKAVRAKMEGHLLLGGESTLFGLELGRQGHRRWEDPEAAEDLIVNKFRLPKDKAYNMKLISPTQAEKLAPQKPKKRKKKGEAAVPVEPPLIGPRQWEDLKKLVVRNPAKPSVRLKSVIKDPYDPKSQAPTTDDFDVVGDDDSDDIS